MACRKTPEVGKPFESFLGHLLALWLEATVLLADDDGSGDNENDSAA